MLKHLISFTILCLGLCGCSDLPEFSSKEELKHHRLQPQNQSYSYVVENVFSMHSQTAPGQKEVPKQSLPQQTWSSRLNLNLTLHWAGYQTHPDFPNWPLANFLIEVSQLKMEESDSLPDWLWSWEEIIGSKPPVIFKINGLTIDKPMGEMLGDPRKYFLKGNNRISFTPIGLPARHKSGELVSKLQVLDHPAFIGQYFLGGLALDEILHRSISLLPPLKMVEQTKWEMPHLSHLKTTSETPITEKWQAKQVSKDGQKLWLINMSLKQNIPSGESKTGNASFQYWSMERQLEAWVNPVDGMPVEITLQEVGSWIDVLSYQNSQNQMIHLPHQHRFKNRFHLRRP